MTRLYRFLLLAYPPSLRRAHGAEMTLAFAERWRAESRGLRGRLGLLGLLFADFFASLPGAWRGGRPPAPGQPGRRRLGELASDVRVSLRHLRRAWPFTGAAVVTLGLGIGASTAVFSLADATLIRPMPIPDVDRVLQVQSSWSLPDYLDLAADQRVFEEVAAWTGFDVGFDRNGTAAVLSALGVSGRYFGLAGVRPVAGRLLDASDDQPGAPAVAVIGARLWRTAFGGDPAIVGRAIRLNGQPVTVVGVAPAWFRGFSLRERPEVFVPMPAVSAVATGFLARPDITTSRDIVWLQVAGRLRPGVDAASARAAVDQLYRRAHPPAEATNRIPEPIELVPMSARALGMASSAELRQFLGVLGAATAVTLLLACAAVGSLLMVRTRTRRREFAIRAALGGGRASIVRLLLVESLLIGLAGTAAGLAAARGTLALLATFALPGGIVIGDLGVSLDLRVLALAAGVGLATSVLFALAPMWQASGVPASAALAEGARGASRRPVSALLVTCQVAACVVLLGGSLAFGRAIEQAVSTDLGFRTDDTAMVVVQTSVARRSTAETLQFYDRVLASAARQPTLAAAGWSRIQPFRGVMMWEVTAPGVAVPTGGDIADRVAEANVVSAGYLEALGIEAAQGRLFDASDRPGSPRVVVISERLADRFWPGQNPVGRQVSTDLSLQDPEQVHTVIGVVSDIQRGLSREVAPTMYLLASQHADMMDFGGNYLIVRAAAGTPASRAAADAAALVTQADPSIPVTGMTTLADAFADTLMAQRMGLTLFLLFATLAMTLTALGLYAIVAYAVAFRRREIGIRLALGASARSVLGLMARQGLMPVAGGLVLGAGLLYLAAPALDRFMFSAAPIDARTALTLAAAVLALAGAAMFVPVRQALGIQPTVALRED